MAKRIEEYKFKNTAPGTSRQILVHRYSGGDSAKKVYIQASLHADEIPALMTANHILKILDAFEAKGLINGEIVFLPMANPIGLGQFIMGKHCGRLEADTGINFNRGFPDLVKEIGPILKGKLGTDEETNIRIIRSQMIEFMDSRESFTEQDELKNLLFKYAVDSDIVLDLHCDFESLMHMYIGAPHWPEYEDLARFIGSEITLVASDSGCEPFDEALARPWWKLAEMFPENPIPSVLMAATIELRGESDVDDELGKKDAQNISRFLASRGFIDIDPGETPKLIREGCDLSACDMLRTPVSGVLAWKKNLGDTVEVGEVVAEVINPEARDFESSRTKVLARNSGVFFSRRRHALVLAGQIIAKLAGDKSLDWRSGNLLSD